MKLMGIFYLFIFDPAVDPRVLKTSLLTEPLVELKSSGRADVL